MARRRRNTQPIPTWSWQEQAACRGMDLGLFFGPDGERQPEREKREAAAKKVCFSCPVRLQCLEHALTYPENYGVWGGMTEDERAAERRRRRRLASAAA